MTIPSLRPGVNMSPANPLELPKTLKPFDPERTINKPVNRQPNSDSIFNQDLDTEPVINDKKK